MNRKNIEKKVLRIRKQPGINDKGQLRVNDVYAKHHITQEFLDEAFDGKAPEEWTQITGTPHYMMHIKDTIHVRHLQDPSTSLYETYLKHVDQKEHSVESFNNLNKLFSEEYVKNHNDNKVVIGYSRPFERWFIRDGLHRVAILFHRGCVMTGGHIDPSFFITQYDRENHCYHISRRLQESGSRVNPEYNGWKNRTLFGYHSFHLMDEFLQGQRDPVVRLANIQKKHSLIDMKVVDYGCNVGGMIWSQTFSKGAIGFDYQADDVRIGNTIIRELGIPNMKIYRHDFDKDKYERVENIVKEFKPDISFLLSLGSWIKTWKSLYKLAVETSKFIVFEMNNEKEGKEQIDYLKSLGCTCELMWKGSEDDSTGNNRRETYWIINP